MSIVERRKPLMKHPGNRLGGWTDEEHDIYTQRLSAYCTFLNAYWVIYPEDGNPKDPLSPGMDHWLAESLEQAEARGEHDVAKEARALIHEGALLKDRLVAAGWTDFAPEPPMTPEEIEEAEQDRIASDELSEALASGKYEMVAGDKVNEFKLVRISLPKRVWRTCSPRILSACDFALFLLCCVVLVTINIIRAPYLLLIKSTGGRRK